MSQEKICAPARVRRRGRHHPDRRRARVAGVLLPGRRPADRGDPRRLPAEPVLQPGEPGGPRGDDGPEIWRQTDGTIAALVAGVGTGGTITGTGRYLKAQNPDVIVVGADPEGSIYSGDVHPYLTEGIGEDFWPQTFDPAARRPLRARLRPRGVPDGATHHARGGHPRRRLLGHRGGGRTRGRARARARRRRRGASCPTRVATTCRSSTRTRGCCSTGSRTVRTSSASRRCSRPSTARSRRS